jgi:peptidyl-prolyl cis-trans isomerase NIMA-interacting 1
MNRATIARAALLGALWVAACGGSPSGGAATPAGVSGGAEGAKCLASADAKYPRKANEPYRITARHILVRYAGARGAAATVTRTREQACLRAAEALDKLKAGMSFADAVTAYSDQPGPSHDGSVGSIQRGDVEAPFADAAFDLEAGEVSEVVETPFGFHVILRVE